MYGSMSSVQGPVRQYVLSTGPLLPGQGSRPARPGVLGIMALCDKAVRAKARGYMPAPGTRHAHRPASHAVFLRYPLSR